MRYTSSSATNALDHAKWSHFPNCSKKSAFFFDRSICILLICGNMLMFCNVCESLAGAAGEAGLLQETRYPITAHVVRDGSFVRSYVRDREEVAAVERNM